VFGQMKRGSYVVLDTSDVEVLSLAFGESSPFARILDHAGDEVVLPR
jgi:hypothetical protein